MKDFLPILKPAIACPPFGQDIAPFSPTRGSNPSSLNGYHTVPLLRQGLPRREPPVAYTAACSRFSGATSRAIHPFRTGRSNKPRKPCDCSATITCDLTTGPMPPAGKTPSRTLPLPREAPRRKAPFLPENRTVHGPQRSARKCVCGTTPCAPKSPIYTGCGITTHSLRIDDSNLMAPRYGISGAILPSTGKWRPARRIRR